MELYEIVLGIILLVLSVALTAVVLVQSGKDKQLSGAISGGADTFFSKQKTGTWDKFLSKATPVMAIMFALLVVTMYLVVK